MFRKLLLCFGIVGLSLTASSQILTVNDLKLQLDGKAIADSTITVSELMQAKKITANFSWIILKETVIYAVGKGIDETLINVCQGDLISQEAKEMFKKLRLGDVVVFHAEKVTNKSGQVIEVSDLVLKIKARH